MSEELIDPMNAELRDLLRAGAPPLAAPSGMEAKLLARLATSIPGLGNPPGGGGGAAVSKAVGVSTGVKAAIAVGVASLAIAGVATFGTGGKPDTVGVRAPVITTIAAPSTGAVAAASNDVPTMNVESLPSAPTGRAPSSATSPAGGASTGASDTTAEHAILDEARNALGRGDSAAALAAIERHQARFPQGALSEEREVLAIRALAAAGRTNDANARAARFKARYPKSLFLPAVEAALAK